MGFIGWLNSNSGAITGIAAMITAGATVVLVGITAFYAWVTRRMHIDAQKPDIAIRLLSTDEFGDILAQLCVENIGSGPARGVEFHDVPPIVIHPLTLLQTFHSCDMGLAT